MNRVYILFPKIGQRELLKFASVPKIYSILYFLIFFRFQKLMDFQDESNYSKTYIYLAFRVASIYMKGLLISLTTIEISQIKYIWLPPYSNLKGFWEGNLIFLTHVYNFDLGLSTSHDIQSYNIRNIFICVLCPYYVHINYMAVSNQDFAFIIFIHSWNQWN